MVHDNPPASPERGRGFLTQHDKDYLLGEAGVEDGSQQERNVRAKIRQRLYDSILDFALLLRHVGERDIDLVFHDRDPEEDYLEEGLAHLLGFVYYADPDRFGARLEEGIEYATMRDGWLADVDVNIDIDRTRNMTDVIEDIESSGEYYTNEQKLLRARGRFNVGTQIHFDHVLGDRDGVPDDIDDPRLAIEYLSLPFGDPNERAEARQAVRVALDHLDRLRDEDDLTPDEIAEKIASTVYEIYPLRYESSLALWQNLLEPSFNEIGAEIPDRQPDV
ncbi:hypothetical protein [Haladaptatus salinisoli]|uniref:hypothetical protein n=1 Tax=Haladaptatus salinisoli TaxID=2884876 RepID=UPI001D0A09EC|nr:hypothetical protein [Haladaptatus salinisoli]